VLGPRSPDGVRPTVSLSSEKRNTAKLHLL
jgi:hypothetical protein